MFDKEKIKIIAEKFNINSYYIFGSYYDGSYTTKSDLDLAFLTKPDRGSSGHYNMYFELKELVKCELDLVDLRKAKLSFAYYIIKNSRVIYDEDENIRTDFEDDIVMRYLDFSYYNRKMNTDIFEDCIGVSNDKL